MTQPLVSIIISNYNYGRFLSDAIDSALSQTYPHTEIMVVDDGSTDDSQDIIARYGDKVTPLLKQNGGQASAFNAGFAASRGDIICFLDADDIILPDRVTTAVRVLAQYPDVMWGYNQVGLMDADGNPMDDSQSEAAELFEFDVRGEIEQGFLKKLPLPLPGTTAFVFRRSLLQQILPMPESEGVSLSDSYVQFASCALGKGIAWTAKLTVQRIHGSNIFTSRPDNQQLTARIHVLTAYWLRVNFPFLHRYTDKLFAKGIGIYWRIGGVELPSRQSVSLYFSSVLLRERLAIATRAIYHYLKVQP